MPFEHPARLRQTLNDASHSSCMLKNTDTNATYENCNRFLKRLNISRLTKFNSTLNKQELKQACEVNIENFGSLDLHTS